MSTIRDTDLVQTNDYAEETTEVRVLDPEGKRLPGAAVPDLSDEALLTMYEAMRTARLFDERAVGWQRQGRLATYAPMSGQEAGQVASTLALADDDWVFPTYREHAVRLVAGFDLPDVLRGLMGTELPCGTADGPTVAPEAIPIATQLPHATGAAMAADHRGDDSVALAHFGDGATSEGDFHEALNFAGVFDAPAVFLCHNNQWAISVPRQRQTASATLAQKARAYGFEGVRVDGMDPIAVRRTVADALGDAREGTPVFVESLTNRQGAHTTSDDPSRYRHRGPELPDWRTADPLERFETYLREAGVLDDELIATVEAETERELDRAVERAEAVPDPDPEELFEPVFAEVTAPLAEQRRQLRSREIDDR